MIGCQYGPSVPERVEGSSMRLLAGTAGPEVPYLPERDGADRGPAGSPGPGPGRAAAAAPDRIITECQCPSLEIVLRLKGALPVVVVLIILAHILGV